MNTNKTIDYKKIVYYISLTVGIFFILYFGILSVSEEQYDFSAYYIAGKSGLNKSPIYYGYTFNTYPILFKLAKKYKVSDPPTHFIYPPSFLLIISPLSILPYIPAKILWIIMNVFILLYLFVKVSSFLYNQNKKFIFKIFVLLVVIIFNNSIKDNLKLGQSNILMLFLFSGSIYFYLKTNSKFQKISALIFSLFCMIRIIPFIIIPIFYKNKKNLISFLMSLLFILLLTFFFFKPSYFNDYFNLIKIIKKGTAYTDNLSLHSAAMKYSILYAYKYNIITIQEKDYIIKYGKKNSPFFNSKILKTTRFISTLILVFTLILFYIALFVYKISLSKENIISSLTYMILFLSPILWQNHLVLLYIPLFLVLKNLNSTKSKIIMFLLIFLILIPNNFLNIFTNNEYIVFFPIHSICLILLLFLNFVNLKNTVSVMPQ